MLKLRKTCTLFVLLLFSAQHATSQIYINSKSKWDLEIGGGTAMYFGDLGDAVELNQGALVRARSSHINYQFNAGANLNLTHRLALSTSFTYGKLSGDDNSSTKPWFKRRNLNFYTNFTEISAEASIVLWDVSNSFNFLHRKTEIYGTAGVGYMWFNPKAIYDGREYELQKLGTEGQYVMDDKQPYRLSTLVIPMGIGVRMKISKLYQLGLKGGMRFTFSDYIDDVSGTYAGSAMYDETGYNAAAVYFADPGTSDNKKKQGDRRGSPTLNDNYAVISVFFTRNIGSKQVNRYKLFTRKPKPYWRNSQTKPTFPNR